MSTTWRIAVKPKHTVSVIAASALALSLAACGSDDSSELDDTPGTVVEETEETEEPEPTAEETEEPTEEVSAIEGTGEIGDSPEEAANPVDVGELIATTWTDHWRIDFFQVGMSTATEDSTFTDDDDQPLMTAGSDLVVMNVVYTNLSGETQYIGGEIGAYAFSTAEWEHVTGIPDENWQHSHFSEFGLDAYPLTSDVILQLDEVTPELPPEGSIAEPKTVMYLPGEPISVSGSVRHVLADGEVDYDNADVIPEGFTITFD